MTEITDKTEDNPREKEETLDDEEREKRAVEARKSAEFLCNELKKYDGKAKRLRELFEKL